MSSTPDRPVTVILHFGMSKSGSTAIQHRLAGLQDWLRPRGLLYPEGLLTRHNHSLLVAMGSEGRMLPRHFRRVYRRDTAGAIRDVEAWFDGVLDRARAQEARAIILSAETLFKLGETDRVAALGRLLRRAGGPITSIAYLRRPSDFYLSAAQQKLKASHGIRTVAPIEYRAPIEAFAQMSDEIRVLPFDRSAFPDGDICKSFVSLVGEVVGEKLPDPPAIPEAANANATISAEGMALMQDYRARHYPDADNRHRKDSNALLEAIVAVEARGDRPRPRLHAEVAEYLDHASTDLAWLRERFGIAFDGIDYDRLGPRPDFAPVTEVAQICPVDEARRWQLSLDVMRALAPLPRKGAS